MALRSGPPTKAVSLLKQSLGERPAESVTPQQIKRGLAAKTNLKPARLNIQMTVRYAHLALKQQLAAVPRLCDTGAAQAAPSDTRTDTGPPARSEDARRIID
jgi:hypothetical protein